MALNTIDAKIKIKTSNVTGQVPVIGPSSNYTDGSWTGSTMVYDREFFYNAVDEKLWIGINEVVTLGSTGDTSTIPLVFASGSTNSVVPSFGTPTNSGLYSTIGGGFDNSITTGEKNGILAGESNSIAGASYASLVGGVGNRITTGEYTFIGGGVNNTVSASKGIIIGGGLNTVTGIGGVIVGGNGHTLQSEVSFIGGGYGNQISGSSTHSSIVGGYNNRVYSSSIYSVIGGGYNNIITGSTHSSIIGGQNNNTGGFDNVHIIGSNITATANNATYVEALMNDDNGTVLRKKVLNIGDWDMDASASATVAHGLSSTEWKTIKTITVIVRNDADTQYFTLYTKLGGSNVLSFNSTNITLLRDAAGQFDSTDFDATSYNRGYVTIEYTPA